MRKFLRLSGFACALSAVAALGLCGYCFLTTASFIFSADEVTGTVVGVEDRPGDRLDRAGLCPVVQFPIAPGIVETRRFSGLYRVDASAVGMPISLLHNPQVRPGLAPRSRWNWIGAIVYGISSVVLAVPAVVILATTRRP